MTIDRLGPIDPVQKFNQSEKAQKTQAKQGSDSISFSDEAKLKADAYKAVEQVKLGADVRADKVAEVKKKLEDPSYINEKVIGTVADRIMEMFGL